MSCAWSVATRPCGTALRSSERSAGEGLGPAAGVDVAALGSRAVLDLRGRSRVLGSVWRNQPAVVVWLRHFACLFCKEQAAELRHEKEAIEASGARLAFVGNGNTAQAQHFHDRHVPGCAIFTDPSAYTYRAIGARESMAATLAGTMKNGPRAMRKGHFQYAFAGRVFQNGGVMIALPGDEAPYVFISKVAGDHPPNTEVISALHNALSGMPAGGQPATAPPPFEERGLVPTPVHVGWGPPVILPWPGAPLPAPVTQAPVEPGVAPGVAAARPLVSPAASPRDLEPVPVAPAATVPAPLPTAPPAARSPLPAWPVGPAAPRWSFGEPQGS